MGSFCKSLKIENQRVDDNKKWSIYEYYIASFKRAVLAHAMIDKNEIKAQRIVERKPDKW